MKTNLKNKNDLASFMDSLIQNLQFFENWILYAEVFTWPVITFIKVYL